MKGFNVTIEHMFENIEEGYDVTCKVEVKYYHCPGYTSGLPENCYPDESEAFVELDDIDSIHYGGDLIDPPEFVYRRFAEKVQALLEEDEHFDAMFQKAEQEAYYYY